TELINQLPMLLRNDVLRYLRLIHRHKPAVVHLWLDDVNIKGGIAAVLAGVPRIILSLRSFPPVHFGFHQPYMREAYRWLFKQQGVILVNNSMAGAAAYEKWLGVPSAGIEVIYNGLSSEFKRPTSYIAEVDELKLILKIPADSPVMGTVIRFTEEKQPFYWLEIASELYKLNQGIYFLLAGDGPLLMDFRDKIRGADIEPNIRLVGHVADVYKYIAMMDLFLLTSRIEGLPNVLIESQLLGVPVVTTNAGGACETMVPDETGWTLEDYNAYTAARKINTILTNDDLLKVAGQNGKEFAKEKFNMENLAAGLQSVYQI
ncbi:MAG: glycosyltransferase, partial [Gammaproteobacteria bacterium]|nr:glycosyltransferase [Gammaproteobacteria bacterium]